VRGERAPRSARRGGSSRWGRAARASPPVRPLRGTISLADASFPQFPGWNGPRHDEKMANCDYASTADHMNAGGQNGTDCLRWLLAASLLSVDSRKHQPGCAAPRCRSGEWGAAPPSPVQNQAMRRCEHRGPVPVCTILWCIGRLTVPVLRLRDAIGRRGGFEPTRRREPPAGFKNGA